MALLERNGMRVGQEILPNALVVTPLHQRRRLGHAPLYGRWVVRCGPPPRLSAGCASAWDLRVEFRLRTQQQNFSAGIDRLSRRYVPGWEFASKVVLIRTNRPEQRYRHPRNRWVTAALSEQDGTRGHRHGGLAFGAFVVTS